MDEWLIWNGINFNLFSNSSACFSVTYHMCFVCLQECNFIFIWHRISVAHLPAWDSRVDIFFIWSTLRIHFELHFSSCVLGPIWFEHKSERRRSAAILILYFVWLFRSTFVPFAFFSLSPVAYSYKYFTFMCHFSFSLNFIAYKNAIRIWRLKSQKQDIIPVDSM